MKVQALREILLLIWNNRAAFMGFIILLLFVLMATVGPVLVPLDLTAHPEKMFRGPSRENWLGTDYAGRDILAQIIHGSRSVLLVAALAVIISLAIAIAVGLAAGFVGGVTDYLLMRVVDVFLTIPGLPLMVVLAAYFRISSPLAMAGVLSITSWAGLARAIRSQVLSLKEREFIQAARVAGLSSPYIIFHEILPNMSSYIAMSSILAVTGAVYAQVGLFFLGLAPFTSTNWGIMLNFAVSQAGALYSTRSISYLLSPIICIILLQTGSILFVRAIDEIFNPRLRTRISTRTGNPLHRKGSVPA